jgi:hypothetical protein
MKNPNVLKGVYYFACLMGAISWVIAFKAFDAPILLGWGAPMVMASWVTWLQFPRKASLPEHSPHSQALIYVIGAGGIGIAFGGWGVAIAMVMIFVLLVVTLQTIFKKP